MLARNRWQLPAFVVANALAGVLHYLFQVSASRELSIQDFSALNSWFAELALFFVIGGVLQYAANFYPWRQKPFLASVVVINIFCLGLVFIWLASPPGQTLAKAMMILSGASLFGWLMGQVQARMLFGYLTAANLLVGAVKLAAIRLPIYEGLDLERYIFALFSCYIPALWLITVAALKHPENLRESQGAGFSWKLWSAPLILSFAAAVIPQLDMVLMVRLQPASVFADFARASLFYKGIYFLVFILCQWLLPKQIHNSKSASRLPLLTLWVVAAAVVGSAALTLLAPSVATIILKWENSPPGQMIFLSCLNMSLLSWIFLLIQESCARGKTRAAAIAILVIGVESALQLTLRLSFTGYYLVALTLQAAIVTLLTAALAKNQE